MSPMPPPRAITKSSSPAIDTVCDDDSFQPLTISVLTRLEEIEKELHLTRQWVDEMNARLFGIPGDDMSEATKQCSSDAQSRIIDMLGRVSYMARTNRWATETLNSRL